MTETQPNPDLISILDAIVSRLVGPWGAFFLLCVVTYFVWRLFREAQRERIASESRVDALTEAVRELTIELRSRPPVAARARR
jgi:hypothetical protein